MHNEPLGPAQEIKIRWLFGPILGVIVVVVGFIALMNLAVPMNPGSQATSGSNEERIKSDGYVGCKTREYSDKLDQYAANRDRQAFENALAAGILSGECTRFRAGESVFLTDTAIFSGLVKIRRAGDLSEYWTNIEAVK
jgi:hypothetical protein